MKTAQKERVCLIIGFFNSSIIYDRFSFKKKEAGDPFESEEERDTTNLFTREHTCGSDIILSDKGVGLRETRANVQEGESNTKVCFETRQTTLCYRFLGGRSRGRT